MLRFICFVIVGMTLLLTGCNKGSSYKDAIVEWAGREILFPDSMRLLGGGFITVPDAEYTIVAYYDSVGCTGCRMKLPFWENFMGRVDSVAGNNRVALLIIAASKDERRLLSLERKDSAGYDIVIDRSDSFNKLNNLPKDQYLQAFLLDKGKKVCVIGNPVIAPSLENVYFMQLAGSDSPVFDDDFGCLVYNHNFGEIDPSVKVGHTFRLRNDTPDTLRVGEVFTSCECTEAEVSSRRILPYSDYEMAVTFIDSVPGSFSRSVSLEFDNNREVRFEISGNLKEQ